MRLSDSNMRLSDSNMRLSDSNMRLSDSNMRLSEQQSHSGSHGMDWESLKMTVSIHKD